MNLDRFGYLIKALNIPLEGVCLTEEDWLDFVRITAQKISGLPEEQRRIVAMRYGMLWSRYISYHDLWHNRPVPFNCISKQMVALPDSRYEHHATTWVSQQHSDAMQTVREPVLTAIQPVLAKSNGHGTSFQFFVEKNQGFVPIYVDQEGFIEVE